MEKKKFETPNQVNRIRVKQIPQGDAPLEIRRSWKGLVLPVYCGQLFRSKDGSSTFSTLDNLSFVFFGCLSNDPKGEFWEVEAFSALEVLEKVDPRAAQYFREEKNFGPILIFARSDCEPLKS